MAAPTPTTTRPTSPRRRPAPRNTASPVNPCGEPVGPILVISQVYGGGGNTGAPYTHDFVELFNRGDAPASLRG
jgi:uncharacterized protein